MGLYIWGSTYPTIPDEILTCRKINSYYGGRLSSCQLKEKVSQQQKRVAKLVPLDPVIPTEKFLNFLFNEMRWSEIKDHPLNQALFLTPNSI